MSIYIYKNWSDEIYLKYCEELTDEQVHRKFEDYSNSVYKILRHIYEVQYWWLERLDCCSPADLPAPHRCVSQAPTWRRIQVGNPRIFWLLQVETTTETNITNSSGLFWFLLIIASILVAYWYFRKSEDISLNLKYWKQEVRNRWDLFLERPRLMYISIIGKSKKIENIESGQQTPDYISQRRCCKLHGRLGDTYCDVCGRVIPKEWIVEKS